MNNATTRSMSVFALLISSCIFTSGCGDSSSTRSVVELSSREAVIDQNIHPRKSVDGEEYENALLPFEQVADDDLRFLADHHPKIRQIILGPLHAGPFEKWKSVEQLTDESLRHLGRLDDLESVNSLAGSSITDEGLAHLSDLTKLQSLDLRGTSVTGKGLSHLRNLEELDSLWLPSSLTAEGVEAVATLNHVRVLSVYCNQDLSPLNKMKNLDRLEILGVEVGTDFGWLPKLTNLDELSVWTINEDVKRAFPLIGQMDHLSRLSIHLPPSDEEIVPFAGCEHLTEIYFKDSSLLTAEAVSTFASMPSLKRLRLHGCQNAFVLGIEPLADKQTLGSMSLHRSTIDDAVLLVLSQFRHLRYLDLNGTQITEAGCRQLYETLGGRCRINPSKGATLGGWR